jgi:hypothetical protein
MRIVMSSTAASFGKRNVYTASMGVVLGLTKRWVTVTRAT